MKPALVLLAAGDSSRLGECKALADLGGTCPVLALLAAGAACDEVPPLVVAGVDARAIAARIPLEVEIAVNAQWRAGRRTPPSPWC